MRKCPSSEWLAFPVLKKEEIAQESFRHSQFLSDALVANRSGRVDLLFDYEEYMSFLDAVRKKFGDISSLSVDKAAHEAVADWIKKGG